jgi:hypothetical protein
LILGTEQEKKQQQQQKVALSVMQEYNHYQSSSSNLGSNGAFPKKSSPQESYPKCVGAASFKFMPVHNIGWSLPVNPMKKSISHEQFTNPSQAYSVSQLKVMQAEPLIAAEFANIFAKLSSGVRLTPPVLLPLYSDTYKKPAKYGYQQNVFKFKNSAPLVSSHGRKEETFGTSFVEGWNAKKDFAFIHEGDGGRDVLEIKDSKKEYITSGLAILPYKRFLFISLNSLFLQVSPSLGESN